MKKQCKFCLKTFSRTGTLKIHIDTAKICINNRKVLEGNKEVETSLLGKDYVKKGIENFSSEKELMGTVNSELHSIKLELEKLRNENFEYKTEIENLKIQIQQKDDGEQLLDQTVRNLIKKNLILELKLEVFSEGKEKIAIEPNTEPSTSRLRAFEEFCVASVVRSIVSGSSF